MIVLMAPENPWQLRSENQKQNLLPVSGKVKSYLQTYSQRKFIFKTSCHLGNLPSPRRFSRNESYIQSSSTDWNLPLREIMANHEFRKEGSGFGITGRRLRDLPGTPANAQRKAA